MTLFTRCIAVLTVLVGLAIMAVSTYAAKDAAARSYPGADGPAKGQGLAAEDAIGTAPGLSFDEEASAAAALAAEVMAAARARAAADATAAAEVSPTPTIALRYPAPAWAVPVMDTRSSRANLSPGARVWRVPSVKPLPGNIERLGQGGLDIPPEQLAVMQQVGLWTGIPWQIFAAIAKVESDLGRNMATSSAGAIGYGQFLPETWAIYGNGGDPYDFHDALPAMGRYLLAAGASRDVGGALYAYNHSLAYVAQVLYVAASYGYPDPGAGPPATSTRSLIWPVIGPISSQFTPTHQGIDIDQTAVPGAPVRAAHDGVVLFAGGDRCCSYGRHVIVVAPSGITTLYAHLDTLAVTAGQTVRQGQSLGPVGCTGNCTGVHLHLEVIENSARRNPLDYLP